MHIGEHSESETKTVYANQKEHVQANPQIKNEGFRMFDLGKLEVPKYFRFSGNNHDHHAP